MTDTVVQSDAPSAIDQEILLVEPNVDLILVVTHILTPHGFEVRAVRDGDQAVEFYRERQKRIALVIVEQDLPGPSGLETMNELLTINPHLPVLLMSGLGRPQSSVWDKTPWVGFLSKPYSADSLVQAVRSLWPSERKKEK